MDPRSLPPLPALQAFEAAARLGSFSAAAVERHLSPSAVSRAVQAVESWCGSPLFERHGPRLRLSAAGEALRERLAEPLQALHQALGLPATHARRAEQALTLQVHTLPSLASSWLLPRLPDLLRAEPRLRLRLITGYAMDSLPPQLPAMALRVGRFERQGLRCWPLWRDPLLAAATPAWVKAQGEDAAAWPAMQRLRLLGEPWPAQLQGRRLHAAEGLEANDALLILQAGLMGLGAVWLRRSLLQPWLDSGALLALAEQDAGQSDKGSWLCCREELAELPALRRFRDWVLAQAKVSSSLREP